MPKSSREKKREKPFWKGKASPPCKMYDLCKAVYSCQVSLKFVHQINSLMKIMFKHLLGNITDDTMKIIILLYYVEVSGVNMLL